MALNKQDVDELDKFLEGIDTSVEPTTKIRFLYIRFILKRIGANNKADIDEYLLNKGLKPISNGDFEELEVNTYRANR